MQAEFKQALEGNLNLLKSVPSRTEFLSAFQKVIDHVLKAEANLGSKIDKKTSEAIAELLSSFNELKRMSNSDFKEVRTDLVSRVDKALKEQSDGLNFIRDKVRKIKEGKDGEDGKDGRSPTNEELQALITPLIPPAVEPVLDTPEKIRDKLESLKGEDRLDASAIKNLEERLKRLEERPVGSVGGGVSQIALQHAMGKLFTHEKFATSSATTTITLANKVAGGVMIFLRYQGQMLHYGDQYTVSGTTVTFTFTLDDSTVVEVSYLKG